MTPAGSSQRSTLPRDAGAVALARRAVEQHAAELSEVELEIARLLVSELVTNAIRHGEGEITLSLRIDERCARFEVQDDRGGQARRRKAAGTQGGFGLNLVETLATRWGVDERSRGVWFELARPARDGASPEHEATAPLEGVRSALAPRRWSHWWAIGTGLAVLLILLESVLGDVPIVSALFVLPPMLCAVMGRWGDTAVVAVVSVALALLHTLQTSWGSRPAVVLIAIAIAGALTVVIALLRAAAEVNLTRFRLLSAIADVGNSAMSLQDAVARLLDMLSPAFADVALLEAAVGEPVRRLGIRPLGADPAAAEAELRLGPPASTIQVPLRARGQVVGTLSMLLGPSGRSYSRSDAVFAEVFGGRAAVVLDNAGLTRELDVAARELDAVLDGLAEAVTVMDAEGRQVYANDAAVELLRLDSAEQLLEAEPGTTMERFAVYDEAGAPVDLRRLPAFRALAGEANPEPLLVRNIVKATGEERWLLNKTTNITDAEGRIVRVANVIEDVTETKRAEVSQRLLAEASHALASSLDYGQTLQRVAEGMVPLLADWCAVELSDEDLVVSAGDATQVERIRATGVPLLNVALVAGGQTLGALLLARTDPHRTFDEADLRLAEELGRRAGSAILNARLHSERSAIAATLQRGLRPPDLRARPGFQLASFYRAAGELNEVGGDFYDAFKTDEGWMLVIGDVTGHGAEAAALTALARYTLHSSGQLTGDPARAVGQLNATLRDLPRLSLCTVVCAHLHEHGDADRVTVTLANCGHPAPLLLAHDGALQPVGASGPVAGAFDDGEWPCTSIELARGDLLLLYTDGVLDTMGDRDRFGDARLRAVLQEEPAREPQALVDRLVARLDAFQTGAARDDAAMVALRFAP